MIADEIMREVRAIREELSARHHHDVRALYEDAKRHERQSNRKIVCLEPRRVEDVIEKSA